jgi:hypothetical protein
MPVSEAKDEVEIRDLVVEAEEIKPSEAMSAPLINLEIRKQYMSPMQSIWQIFQSIATFLNPSNKPLFLISVICSPARFHPHL